MKFVAKKQAYQVKDYGNKASRRDYSTVSGALELPNLVEIQTESFERFLKEDVKGNPMKSEALLPNDVGRLIDDKSLNVKILETPDRWYGVTYQDDKPLVLETFARLQKDGSYPEKLWVK